jgi:hypothetical protein
MMRQFEVKPCILVTNTDDDGPGSLRYALDCALPGDTIAFATELAGDTIFLEDSIRIGKHVSIVNTHAQRITVSAANQLHLFHITGTGVVHLEQLNLVAGLAEIGRGLLNEGTLVLREITLMDSMPFPAAGHPVDNKGMLLIRGSVDLTR